MDDSCERDLLLDWHDCGVLDLLLGSAEEEEGEEDAGEGAWVY